jgi:protein-disulfide isomerase
MIKNKNEFLILRLYFLGAAIIIGMAIVVGARMISDALFMGQLVSSRRIAFSVEEFSKQVTSRPSQAIQEPGTKIVKGVTSGMAPVKGDPKAKVLIVVFGDLTCPYCRMFNSEILPLIDKEFIQTGKVKLAYRNFFSHKGPAYREAALALICSQGQDKYWQMLDALAKSESLDRSKIDQLAQGLGMDKKKFQACLDNKAANDLLADDLSSASKLGVYSTPTIFINGRLIDRAYPYEVFRKIIEEELSK